MYLTTLLIVTNNRYIYEHFFPYICHKKEKKNTSNAFNSSL